MHALLIPPTRPLRPSNGGQSLRPVRPASGLRPDHGSQPFRPVRPASGLYTDKGGQPFRGERLATSHRWQLPVAAEENRLLEILRHTAVCELAPATGAAAEAMRLDFGYRDDLLYCRAEPDGWQLNLARLNHEVRFTIAPEPGTVAPHPRREPERRVVGTGWAWVVEEPDAKREALDVILAHYGRPGPFLYDADALRRNAVIQVTVYQWHLEPAPSADPVAGAPSRTGGPS